MEILRQNFLQRGIINNDQEKRTIPGYNILTNLIGIAI